MLFQRLVLLPPTYHEFSGLSACLLDAAVSCLGIPVTSLNGYVLGIPTNSDFGRASVKSVDPQPIRAALQEHDIVLPRLISRAD